MNAINNTSFLQELKIEPAKHRVISVAGGGGKTSLIFRLNEELVSQGKKVIVTTTTHMAYEPLRPFACDADRMTIQKNLKDCGYCVTACLDPGMTSAGVKKISALPEDRLSELCSECDVLLIEADGAHRLPVKSPADYEPVIPDFTDLVIGVIGLDCLGKKIEDTAHRPEILADLLNKSVSETLYAEDLVILASSETGLKKAVNEKEYRVYFNKADTLSNYIDVSGEILRPLVNRGIFCAYGSLAKTCIHTYTLGIVLLAAGFAKRFGSNKLLCEIDGNSMCEKVFDVFKEVRDDIGELTGLHCVIAAVTQYEEVRAFAEKRDFLTVINEQPERGISSSMQEGLKAFYDTDACMFSVCDQPWLTKQTVALLIRDYLSSDKGIACAAFENVPGNPCIFSKRYYQRLMTLKGDRGGKVLLSSYPEDVIYTECSSLRELIDIDQKPEL